MVAIPIICEGIVSIDEKEWVPDYVTGSAEMIDSDNYMSLMPEESRKIIMSVRKEDARGERSSVGISGYNIKE